MRHVSILCTLVVLLPLGGGAIQAPNPQLGAGKEQLPILVQGAMPVETAQLVKRLQGVATDTVGSWTFWRGTIDGYPVIVSKTMKGVANAAAATAIAIERYHPSAIINQGTAGGHDPELHVRDIVLGAYAVSLGGFKTAYRARGQGSNPVDWAPMDLLASEGSASLDPAARTMRRFQANRELLAAAESVRAQYGTGKVVTGVIGSSDTWNSEIDRIEHLRREYHTSVEEMETAAAAQVAGLFQVPFLGIRGVSNNITNAGAYDAGAGEACQEYVYLVVMAYIAAARRGPL